jgi:hypothetical protein
MNLFLKLRNLKMRSKMLSFREMVNKKSDEWKKKYDSHLKWMDEYRESRGIVFLEEEKEYEGETKNGIPHGIGTLKWGDEKYVGRWKNGKEHGKGSHIFPDGTFYKGIWKNGEFWDVSWYDKDGKRSFYDFGDRYGNSK